ncbi:hypothetical protein F511_33320 [Dorcoceras hygrometricum]|uniref:Uncharacterized protein n=1 Tax=Dorcoceras hygrometricum TaxID=472368 RepID=A0A2Z7ADM4_9LAMI|nr:hypothetical protein F511_33320 [Dorcoceras hygrometricum]
MSVPPVLITKKNRTKRTKKVKPTADHQAESQPVPFQIFQLRMRLSPTLVGLQKPIWRQLQWWKHKLMMSLLPVVQKTMWEQLQRMRDCDNDASTTVEQINPTAKGKGMLEAFARPNPVEEHCQLVLKTAWEDVSSKTTDYHEWVHFLTAVRLKDVSSSENLAKI